MKSAWKPPCLAARVQKTRWRPSVPFRCADMSNGFHSERISSCARSDGLRSNRVKYKYANQDDNGDGGQAAPPDYGFAHIPAVWKFRTS